LGKKLNSLRDQLTLVAKEFTAHPAKPFVASPNTPATPAAAADALFDLATDPGPISVVLGVSTRSTKAVSG
jgi:hypothetical protein